MPSSPLRRSLRAAGHHLAPVVQVGKEGVTEALLRQLDRALLDHELVKVKAGTETPEDRFGTADALLAGASGAQLAQILGRTLLLYRRHPEKPRFEPLPAPPRTAARSARPKPRGRPVRGAGNERRGRPERSGGPPRRRG
jgi:RNA-binding protein